MKPITTLNAVLVQKLGGEVTWVTNRLSECSVINQLDMKKII
jgi:hypothetical protein